MGYAGNIEPSYLIPTVIADSLIKVNSSLLSYLFIDSIDLN